MFEKLARQVSNKGGQPSRFGIALSLDDYPKTSKEKEYIEKGSLCFSYWNFSMYGMLCTRTDKDFKEIYFCANLYDLCDDASVWMSIKLNSLFYSTMEAKWAAIEAFKEAVKYCKFLSIFDDI